MSLYDIPLTTLDGKDVDLSAHRGEVLLAVNVASKCGFTPQYSGLEKLHETYAGQGFAVLGFPCNQFLFQESGSSDTIAEFCSATYGVTFPMFEKVKVKGPRKHPLFRSLIKAKDPKGRAGGVRWNFEKFLIDRQGEVVARWRSTTTPDDPAVRQAIETALAG